MRNLIRFASAILIFIAAQAISAQTTAFNYQGKLTDAGTPQSSYQMQFKLFDALSGGAQIGGTIENLSVAVNQGVFSILLDFGANVFSGADRFLEISVRKNPNETYTTLAPRQQIAASPYSIHTLRATQADLALDANKLGGLSASEYVTNTSLGNTVIRNQTTLQTADFNISGSGFFGGRVGIGTNSPNTPLSVSGGVPWTSNGWTAAMNLQNGSGLGWEANQSGQRFGIGQTNSGLFFIRTNSAFGNTTNPAFYDLIISDSGNVGIGINSFTPSGKLEVGGNVTQLATAGGVVKAMLYVDANGTIVRCYNGVTGAATGNCGFTVTRPLTGVYQVRFGFQVDNRFGMAISGISASHARLNYFSSGGSGIEVYTDNNQNQQQNSDFTLIVY